MLIVHGKILFIELIIDVVKVNFVKPCRQLPRVTMVLTASGFCLTRKFFNKEYL